MKNPGRLLWELTVRKMTTFALMKKETVVFNEVLTVNSLLQGLPQLHRAAMPSTMPVSGCPESNKGWRGKKG